MNVVMAVKENPLLRRIYDALTSIVRIIPCYLFRERLLQEEGLNVKPRLDGCEIAPLQSFDIRAISAHPEVIESEDVLRERLANGCLCLGLKHRGDIIAYTWCNLRDGPFGLKDDEAYLFNARTFKAYRGKNLAPYLRYQLYRHLARTGRTKFLSTNSLFNSSAIKFKKKLKAKPCKLFLQISLFKKYNWNILLKDYEMK